MTEQAPAPSEVFARQLREIRERRRWSQSELARRLTDLDRPKNQGTIARLESGKLTVSLDDAVAIAAALEVSLSSLILPRGNDELVAVTPKTVFDAGTVRKWLDRQEPLPGHDDRVFFTELPDGEFQQRVAGMYYGPLVQDLFAGLSAGDPDRFGTAALQLFQRWTEGREAAEVDPAAYNRQIVELEAAAAEAAGMRPKSSKPVEKPKTTRARARKDK